VNTFIPSIGDRVRITGIMRGDPDPLPIGTTGTVRDINPDKFQGVYQIYVDWDIDRSLILLSTDPYVVDRREVRR